MIKCHPLTIDATIILEQANYTVNEDAEFVIVCALLVEGDLQRDVDVQLLVMDVSANGKL